VLASSSNRDLARRIRSSILSLSSAHSSALGGTLTAPFTPQVRQDLDEFCLLAGLANQIGLPFFPEINRVVNWPSLHAFKRIGEPRCECVRNSPRVRHFYKVHVHYVASGLVQTSAEPNYNSHDIPDDRLRLIFTCCHPALAAEAQVALTLRTLCGLDTDEIARAFLVPGPTVAQRLVRAKHKIQLPRGANRLCAPIFVPKLSV